MMNFQPQPPRPFLVDPWCSILRWQHVHGGHAARRDKNNGRRQQGRVDGVCRDDRWVNTWLYVLMRLSPFLSLKGPLRSHKEIIPPTPQLLWCHVSSDTWSEVVQLCPLSGISVHLLIAAFSFTPRKMSSRYEARVSRCFGTMNE